jgi:hypothetical protein
MTFPSFTAGEVLRAADMNAVGLWLVKTQTIGAGVSSVPVTGVFSSDYDNYKIVVFGGAANTGQAVALQFGPSSVTGYNSGYNSNIIIYTFPNPPVLTTIGSSSATNWPYVGEANASTIAIDIDVIAPNLAKFTNYNGAYNGADVAGMTGGVHKQAQQYTDFTLTVSGTLTGGTIQVYGYKK